MNSEDLNETIRIKREKYGHTDILKARADFLKMHGRAWGECQECGTNVGESHLHKRAIDGGGSFRILRLCKACFSVVPEPTSSIKTAYLHMGWNARCGSCGGRATRYTPDFIKGEAIYKCNECSAQTRYPIT